MTNERSGAEEFEEWLAVKYHLLMRAAFVAGIRAHRRGDPRICDLSNLPEFGPGASRLKVWTAAFESGWDSYVADSKDRLGIDVGGVIRANGQLVPGALEGIAKLRILFGDRMYIVSRVNDGKDLRDVSVFLSDSKIYNLIDPNHVCFCYQRHEKGPIVKSLEITHFIDDRTEVLSYMNSVPFCYAMNPEESQLKDFPPIGMTVVNGWGEIVPLIEGTLLT